MRFFRPPALLLAACLLGLAVLPTSAGPVYVRKGTRLETVLASLKASGLPPLEGPWHLIGPFDNSDLDGFDTAYPPEREINLKKSYPGKGGETVAWKEFGAFRVGRVVNLARFKKNDFTIVYLFHEIDSPGEITLPVSLGSDDSLKVFLNGKELLATNTVRGAAPDQDRAE